MIFHTSFFYTLFQFLLQSLFFIFVLLYNKL